jgi:hypothetical protein
MTRLAALVVFVVMVSYTNRAFAVTTGSDQLLRIFSLLLAISPIQCAFAIDQRLWGRRADSAITAVPAYGLLLMRLQVLIVYYQTVRLKAGDGFWRRGDIMSYFLMSMYSRYPARQWADWETLSAVLTYATLLSKLALFSFCMMRTYLAFLEREDVDALVAWTRTMRKRLVKA